MYFGRFVLQLQWLLPLLSTCSLSVQRITHTRAHHTRRLQPSTLNPSPPSTLVFGREISDSLLNNFPLDFNDQGAASPHPSQTRPCPKAALQPPANDAHSRRPPLAQATALKMNNQHSKLDQATSSAPPITTVAALRTPPGLALHPGG